MVSSAPLPSDAPAREWSYLSSTAFQSRQVLAAWFVDAFPDVVEIGGYRSPISHFLQRPHTSVTVLDPLVVPHTADTLNGAPCNVRHVPSLFQDWKEWPSPMALVLLGLDFELYEQTRATRRKVLAEFKAVIDRSDRIVVEYARDWTASRWLAEWVMESSGYTVKVDLKMDVCGDLGVDLSNSWTPLRGRRLLVLDRPKS